MMNRVECPIFLPRPGDRIRVVLRYKDSWRPIFWFKLSKDGSIYLGPRLTNISQLKSGKANPIVNNEFRIQYAAGESIDDPEWLEHPKLSFHGSGIVNMPGSRTLGERIRSIKEQVLLCFAVFRHLSHFDIVTENQVKNRDVCLNYPIAETRPLFGQLWIAPSAKVYPVLHDANDIKWQINAMFHYEGIEEIGSLTVQLVLAYGAEGPWPPYNYLFFAGRNGE